MKKSMSYGKKSMGYGKKSMGYGKKAVGYGDIVEDFSRVTSSAHLKCAGLAL